MNKLLLLLLLFLLQLKGYSKEQPERLFCAELIKKATQFKTDDAFFRMHTFYNEGNWDSVMVYSFKTLNNKQLHEEAANYAHYCRAFCFMKKRLFNESQKEFLQVGSGFDFYYNVQRHLGENALELKRFPEALRYFEHIEKLPDSVAYDFNKSVVLHNMGITYLHLENYVKAEEYLFKCLALQQVQKDTLHLIGTYMDIAGNYYDQYKDAQAIPYYEKAYALSKFVSDLETKQNAARNMAVVEENRHRTAQALSYRKEYETWKDSLNNQNKIWDLAEIEKKFAISQKQKEVNLLEASNRLKATQRNAFILASLLLLLMLGAGIYFYRQKIKTNQIILAQKEELDALNATKDKLFSIVSHDLRASVNALKRSNSKIKDDLTANDLQQVKTHLSENSEIANGTYNLLDNLLNWALLQTKQSYFKQELHPLRTLCDHVLFNYKSFMLEKNLRLENHIDKEHRAFVDQDSFKIMLRNLLDNAIKFSQENGSIHIYSNNDDAKFMRLIVEDNGVGMSESTRQELLKDDLQLKKNKSDAIISSGLGLHLCKSLMAKNGGQLSIESKEGQGTQIILSFLKQFS